MALLLACVSTLALLLLGIYLGFRWTRSLAFAAGQQAVARWRDELKKKYIMIPRDARVHISIHNIDTGEVVRGAVNASDLEKGVPIAKAGTTNGHGRKAPPHR